MAIVTTITLLGLKKKTIENVVMKNKSTMCKTCIYACLIRKEQAMRLSGQEQTYRYHINRLSEGHAPESF